jgi:glycosyltransferase involved in cell wall biosynthesis
MNEVSIIIPCFNAAQTLEAAIESCLSQRESELEVLVIDDGSLDNSLAVARKYEPEIRVVSGPNRGVSAARNRGISETTGNWIIFLDSDDILLSGTVRERLNVGREAAADVVICDWRDIRVDPKGGISTGPDHAIDWAAVKADAESAIAVSVWATTAAIMYRRSIVQKIGGFRLDLPVIQDARLLFDAAFHGARFVHSPHVGASYRVTPGSLSRRNRAEFWQDVLLNGQQIEALWRSRGSLDYNHRQAVAKIYNTAVRGLFSVEDGRYFHAVELQRGLGLPLPQHSRIVPTLARLFGLRLARIALAMVGR